VISTKRYPAGARVEVGSPQDPSSLHLPKAPDAVIQHRYLLAESRQCMTSLLGRSLGLIGPQSFQRTQIDWRVRELRAAPWLTFDEALGNAHTPNDAEHNASSLGRTFAHTAGVNCLTIEGFRSRL
jgi:hypothetical protein